MAHESSSVVLPGAREVGVTVDLAFESGMDQRWGAVLTREITLHRLTLPLLMGKEMMLFADAIALSDRDLAGRDPIHRRSRRPLDYRRDLQANMQNLGALAFVVRGVGSGGR